MIDDDEVDTATLIRASESPALDAAALDRVWASVVDEGPKKARKRARFAVVTGFGASLAVAAVLIFAILPRTERAAPAPSAVSTPIAASRDVRALRHALLRAQSAALRTTDDVTLAQVEVATQAYRSALLELPRGSR